MISAARTLLSVAGRKWSLAAVLCALAGVSAPAAEAASARSCRPVVNPYPGTWHGWRVTGDLRGSSDRYLATRGDRRVRWRF